MTGLDKIISQILDEANVSAKEQIEQAKAQAEEIKRQAGEEAEKAGRAILERSETEAANYKERAASSMDLSQRTALLKVKQEMIAKVLETAYEELASQDVSEYFQTIREMLKKFILPQAGEILFSQKDLERMPEGFEKEIQKMAADKGGALSLSRNGAAIENGFILVYGGIEENCSFKALFNSRRDELQDQVQKILFV